MRKFKVGDKVTIRRDNQRTPKWILRGLNLYLPRTITATFYDKVAQHTRYYLGWNNRGQVDLESVTFRASQLKAWEQGEVGRPQEKREYKIK